VQEEKIVCMTVTEINDVLSRLAISPASDEELSPLKAA